MAKHIINRMSKDVLRVVVSDFHSGSNFALFLKRPWQGKQTAVIHPRSVQVAIRQRFELFASEVKTARKNKRVELIHNGDAIDGDHHHSGDVCTLNTKEQAGIHIELMSELQRRIGWQAGDKLYYTKGTPVHVNDDEEYIAEQLNAVQDAEGYHCHNFLELNTNGVRSWFVHHGKGRGEGANEGNALRNWLKSIYLDAEKDQRAFPDIIYTGHVHDPTYNTYVYRRKMNFSTMHGVILPSWQAKTAFAHMKAPVSRNKIGGVMQTIYGDGGIGMPYYSIMETQ